MNRRTLLGLLPFVPAGGFAALATKSNASVPTVDSLAKIQWTGDDPATIGPAEAVLAAEPDALLTRQYVIESMKFYNGDQWPHDIVTARENANRPTLVVNKLPGLFASALAARPPMALQLSHRQMSALILAIVRRNRDAQCAYNYMCSAQVEMAQSKLAMSKVTIARA
jgi:hypothetical protein